jgi:hypothetical protein
MSIPEPPRMSIPVRLGRKEGLLAEIDAVGACVRHTGALKLGGEVQLSFTAAGEVFVAASRVLACRVVGLGLGEGGSTLFESRLRFDEERGEALERLFGAVGTQSQTAKV